ncbi:MAG: His Kinase (phospho-acceptor) protein [Daejeonella sp.]|nr:His Kinase (phospho-acceptor) protein [Daejeonella sp.]
MSERFIGNAVDNTLEERIFHNVCLVSIAALTFAAVFSYGIGLPVLALVHSVVCTLVIIIYYFSRFKNQSYTSIVLYSLLSNVLFVTNYYLNSGIDGPTLMLFILSMFSLIAVAPKKHIWIWLTLNILEISTLLFLQYNSPEGSLNTYQDKFSRYLDMAVSYPIVIFFIYQVTRYIRNSHDREKKKVEEKARELEFANDTKNKLLSILAHDLRSPLGSIQGYLEILVDANLPDDNKVTLQKNLLQKTQHTSEMLSNLLSWTQAQMEGVKVKLIKVNLADTLKNTLFVQANIAKQKGVTIQNNLEKHIWLIADQDMLQLVIRNLVNNAIKFTSHGGVITLSSQILEGNCVISVTDNGVGIPYGRQKDIFSLKGESTYGTKKEKGVGLGLLLCQEFIQLQKGKIWLESEPGVRTAFYVSLKSCLAPTESEPSDYMRTLV